jgi:hypothetical protein
MPGSVAKKILFLISSQLDSPNSRRLFLFGIGRAFQLSISGAVGDYLKKIAVK